MAKNLVTRAEFSRIAGTEPANITKVCLTSLAAAVVGRRIDAAHPDALAYIEKQQRAATPEPAPGVDPLYPQAVDHCRDTGRFTVSAISRGLGIGYARATRIFSMMQAAGVDSPPKQAAPAPVTKEPPAPPERVIRGGEARNKNRKAEALARLNAGPSVTDEMEQNLLEIPADILKFLDMTLRELIRRHGTDVAFLDWLKATKQIEDINEKRLKNAATKGELVSRELVKVGVLDQINGAHMKLLTDGAKTIALRVVAMSKAGREVDECEKFIADQISSFIKPAKVKMVRALKNA